MIIVALVVVLGLGGGGAFYLRSAGAATESTTEKSKKKGKGHKKAAAKEEADGEEEEEHEAEDEEEAAEDDSESPHDSLPDDSEVKHVIELQPFIVNLADEDEARYLRLTVSLGVSGGEGGKEEEKPDPLFTTRVRNSLLAMLTTKHSKDVLTSDGKAKLRKELLKAAQAASEEPEVHAIYITDFIVQL